MGIARAALLESGRELVEAGVLERADDLFFLQMKELNVLAMAAPGDWRRLVQVRSADTLSHVCSSATVPLSSRAKPRPPVSKAVCW